MALAYPLTTEIVEEALQYARRTEFQLGENLIASRTRGGEQLVADLGERLWQGSAEFGPLLRTEAGRPEALVETLRQAGRTFYIHDRRRPAPLLDPTGSIVAGYTPKIQALGGDARNMSLQDLPPDYVLSAGDYIAFDYGTGPVRRALHRVVPATYSAGALGATGLFEVYPAIRPGAAALTPVTLVKAACKAVLVPGSVVAAQGFNAVSEGLSFNWVQTLR